MGGEKNLAEGAMDVHKRPELGVRREKRIQRLVLGLREGSQALENIGTRSRR